MRGDKSSIVQSNCVNHYRRNAQKINRFGRTCLLKVNTMGEISWTASKTISSYVWWHLKAGAVRSNVKQINKNNSDCQAKQDLCKKQFWLNKQKYLKLDYTNMRILSKSDKAVLYSKSMYF